MVDVSAEDVIENVAKDGSPVKRASTVVGFAEPSSASLNRKSMAPDVFLGHALGGVPVTSAVGADTCKTALKSIFV